MNTFLFQALHLIGQALLEEKTQLEACTVEEVTFDFSLKARCEQQQSPLSIKTKTDLNSMSCL